MSNTGCRPRIARANKTMTGEGQQRGGGVNDAPACPPAERLNRIFYTAWYSNPAQLDHLNPAKVILRGFNETSPSDRIHVCDSKSQLNFHAKVGGCPGLTVWHYLFDNA